LEIIPNTNEVVHDYQFYVQMFIEEQRMDFDFPPVD